MNTLHQTLGSLVAAQPGLAPVFESLGLDFCCGGHRTLEAAATEAGLDPMTVAKMLAALPPSGGLSPTGANPALLSTPELIDHIIATHHAFVRRELPRLVDLSAKVARAHGGDHPEAVPLQTCVGQLSDALLPHLEAEEKDLFPALRAVEGQTSGPSKESLAPYFDEHEEAGALLAQASTLTGDFAHPAWACATYRTFMDALKAFELDLHQHIHLENNVLFSRIGG